MSWDRSENRGILSDMADRKQVPKTPDLEKDLAALLPEGDGAGDAEATQQARGPEETEASQDVSALIGAVFSDPEDMGPADAEDPTLNDLFELGLDTRKRADMIDRVLEDVLGSEQPVTGAEASNGPSQARSLRPEDTLESPEGFFELPITAPEQPELTFEALALDAEPAEKPVLEQKESEPPLPEIIPSAPEIVRETEPTTAPNPAPDLDPEWKEETDPEVVALEVAVFDPFEDEEDEPFAAIGAVEADENPPQPLPPLGADFEALFAPVVRRKAEPVVADPLPASDPSGEQIPTRASKSNRGSVEGGAKQARLDAQNAETRDRRQLDRALGRSMPSAKRRWRVRAIWCAFLAALTYVAFLPYTPDVGGEFFVQPAALSQVRARSDGEIVEVHVQQGDWVEAEQVLATLSNWNERQAIALQEVALSQAKAELQTLIDGARPEEIALREQVLTSAELRVEFATSEFERTEQLFASGTVSQRALDAAQETLLLAQSAKEEARIALHLIRSGARDSDVAAARARIAGIEQELDFANLELERSFLRTNAPGQIVSDLSLQPVGAYLHEGGLFAELEDNRVMFAHIEVPETEIDEVAPDAEVELRLWSDAETRLAGTVYRIAPKAEDRPFGKIIRVTVEVPNESGKLASGMTGFGKIITQERPVWQAFSRMILLFFQIELWSWLP